MTGWPRARTSRARGGTEAALQLLSHSTADDARNPAVQTLCTGVGTRVDWRRATMECWRCRVAAPLVVGWYLNGWAAIVAGLPPMLRYRLPPMLYLCCCCFTSLRLYAALTCLGVLYCCCSAAGSRCVVQSPLTHLRCCSSWLIRPLRVATTGVGKEQRRREEKRAV